MVDHHSPAAVPPEAPAASDRSPALASARLEAVEHTVRQMAEILAEHLPRRLGEQASAQRRQLEELARELGGAFRSLLDQVKGSSGALGEQVAAVEARLAASAPEAADRLQRELDRRLQQEAERFEARLEALEAANGELATTLRDEVGALQGVPERVAEGITAVREAVGDMAAAHAAVEARLEEIAAAASTDEIRGRVDQAAEALAGPLGDAVGNLRLETQELLVKVDERLKELSGAVGAVRLETDERISALQAGLERVDTLAEAVESIGRRRGFKHVVASDERLRQEQAAMSERLAQAGELLGGRLDDVRDELKGLREAARDAQAGLLAEEIRRRVVDELVNEEMVKAMLERVEETVERRFEELASRLEGRLDGPVRAESSRRRLFRREQG